MNTKTLDLTKPVQTKSGIKMRVLCTDAACEYPVICIENRGNIYRYKLDGEYIYGGSPNEYDLINSPEMVEIDVWVNVYRDEESGRIGGGNLHSKKEFAVRSKDPDALCTLHIKRTVPVGHVDE